MKTNNLTRKSLLTSLIMMATAAFNNVRFQHQKTHDPAVRHRSGGYIWGGFRARNLQAIYIPPRKKHKGYERKLAKSTFNKNR